LTEVCPTSTFRPTPAPARLPVTWAGTPASGET